MQIILSTVAPALSVGTGETCLLLMVSIIVLESLCREWGTRPSLVEHFLLDLLNTLKPANVLDVTNSAVIFSAFVANFKFNLKCLLTVLMLGGMLLLRIEFVHTDVLRVLLSSTTLMMAELSHAGTGGFLAMCILAMVTVRYGGWGHDLIEVIIFGIFFILIRLNHEPVALLALNRLWA